MFSFTSAKTVTVRVPAGAEDWDGIVSGSPYSGSNTTVNWGNGFRGGGWRKPENAFQSGGSVNSNITLTIQEE